MDNVVGFSPHTYQVGETGGSTMNGLRGVVKHSLWLGGGAAVLLAVCLAGPAAADPISLSGSNEVPPVNTQANGIADISIVQHNGPAPTSASNCPTALGPVSVGGMTPTAAHVHRAAAGQNGPVVVPLTQRADNPNIFYVLPGTTVSQDIYEAWWNGQLYVNVH